MLIGRLYVPAEIGAVDVAGDGLVLDFRRHGLAGFVGHHGGRLILGVEVARELQSAVSLGAVGEDRDDEEIVPDRQLAAGEDRPRGDGRLMLARLAVPELALGERVDGGAGTPRADRIALGDGPADQPENVQRLLIRKSGKPREAQAPCGFREEEMSRHYESDPIRPDATCLARWSSGEVSDTIRSGQE